MKIEHTIKRENGDKIVIIVETTNSPSTYIPLFDVSITVTPKGKRKPSIDTRSHSFDDDVFGRDWRNWNFYERNAKRKEYILQLVTIEEIREAREELLNAMREDSYRF